MGLMLVGEVGLIFNLHPGAGGCCNKYTGTGCLYWAHCHEYNICVSLLSNSSRDYKTPPVWLWLWCYPTPISRFSIDFLHILVCWSNRHQTYLSVLWKIQRFFPLRGRRWWWWGGEGLDPCWNLSSSWPDRSEIWSNNRIFNINHNHHIQPPATTM